MWLGHQRLPTAVVLLLLCWSPGCGRGASTDRPPENQQPTTTYSFSILEGRLPRVLFMGRERGAELLLRNDGFNAWQGDRKFFFAPRWLDVRGRVIEEGFRNPVPAQVDPGEDVQLAVRVKPPEGFGLYRSQWDLLSNQSGWFEQFDQTPETPRWVLVLPPVEFFLAVLIPNLLLGAAIYLRKRSDLAVHGLAAVALPSLDLIWCAASLLGKPYLLYAELAPKFWPGPKLVTFSVVALLLLSIYYLPARFRSLAAWCLAAFGALVVWVQLLYFRFFLDLASSVAALAGRQAADLGATIGFLSRPTDLWLILDLLLAVPVLWWLVPGRNKSHRPRRQAVAIALGILAIPFLLSGVKALASGQLQSRRNLQNLRSVSVYGLYGFQLLDAGTRIVGGWSENEVTPQEFDRALAWFEETRPQRQAEPGVGGQETAGLTGIATGLNLIAIQVESMQEFVIDLDVDGSPVMPNLRRLRGNALEFSNVLDQTSRGRSSAGDFVAMTSMIPVGESIAYEHPENEYYSIGHALARQSYTTLSAIPYKGSFWNRQTTHPAYGFDTNLFRASFERRGPRVGWGVNDIDFLAQMAPLLDSLDEPFFAWLTTLSVHYPYESFPDELKSRSMGDLEGTPLGNYLHGMSLFDRAFQSFLDDLKKNGLLDRTVIAIWGDHGSGLNRDQQFLDYFNLATPAQKFLHGRVPFLIWLPQERSLRRLDTAPAGQIDIAPTLLGLMGVEAGDLALMGRNLLLDSAPTRVVHPQGKWFDPELIYLSQFAESEGACWSVSTLAPVHPSRCDAGTADAERQLEIVSLVLHYNLQAEISRRLGGIETGTSLPPTEQRP